MRVMESMPWHGKEQVAILTPGDLRRILDRMLHQWCAHEADPGYSGATKALAAMSGGS